MYTGPLRCPLAHQRILVASVEGSRSAVRSARCADVYRAEWARGRRAGTGTMEAVPSRLDVIPVSPDRPVSPCLDRRSVLRSAGGGAIALVALGAASACSDKTPPAPDVLVTQEVSARTDAVWAKAAIATAPEHTAALTTVAAQRTQHADALRAEIDRATGVYGDGTKPRSASPPVTEPVAPAPPPDLATVRTRLTESQHSAAALAATLSGYRAGLLGSISACCATHVTVVLA